MGQKNTGIPIRILHRVESKDIYTGYHRRIPVTGYDILKYISTIRNWEHILAFTADPPKAQVCDIQLTKKKLLAWFSLKTTRKNCTDDKPFMSPKKRLVVFSPYWAAGKVGLPRGSPTITHRVHLST
jgi:hypothetical protein